MLRYSWRWVKGTDYDIQYMGKTGPKGKNIGSGEDDWQVARQEGGGRGRGPLTPVSARSGR
jgi:hypothetical protein